MTAHEGEDVQRHLGRFLAGGPDDLLDFLPGVAAEGHEFLPDSEVMNTTKAAAKPTTSAPHWATWPCLPSR